MRTSLVTGVAGGIGGAVARAFMQAGWRVIGVDRRDPPSDAAIARYVAADVGEDGGVARLMTELADVEVLHALVNNAAVSVDLPLTRTSDAAWAEVLNTNVRGPFQLIRDTYPLLRRGRGAVINVASVHGMATSANVAAYATSKGALLALTRAAAIELGEHGIRCNAVVPGAIDTAMFREGLSRRSHPQGPSGNLEQLLSRTPLGTVAGPEAVAEAVLFLSDPLRSGYITGQTLVIDGGALARLSTE